MSYESVLKNIPDSVQLIAVSKYRTVPEILKLYNSGQRLFAENRVQALLERMEQLPSDIEWHLIGHLQTNKAKYIVPNVALVHSADSVKILETLNKEAAKIQKRIRVLLQIKIAQEEEKFGFNLNDLYSLLQDETHLLWEHVQICGVMGMGTLTQDTQQTEKEFETLFLYFQRLKKDFFGSDPHFIEISMGMSGDYELAIKHGATMVRIGSALFEE